MRALVAALCPRRFTTLRANVCLWAAGTDVARRDVPCTMSVYFGAASIHSPGVASLVANTGAGESEWVRCWLRRLDAEAVPGRDAE